MTPEEMKPYVGKHVRITYADGHRERVYLQDVGYMGFRVLIEGQRYVRTHCADVVTIDADRKAVG